MKHKREIISIGDLHGNIDAFYGNLIFAGVINKQGERIGGNKTLIFHGDILGDRHENGIQIMLEINKLREKAKKNGGQIYTICGNHDYKFIIYLLTNIELNYPANEGLLELKEFATERYKKTNKIETLREDKYNIFENMKKSQKGRKIIEEILKFKLVHRIQDIVFIHTNPSCELLQTINESGIKEINKIFRNGILQLLGLKEKNQSELESLFKMSKIFLSGNRRHRIPEYEKGNIYDKLSKKGIKYIINGHDGSFGQVDIKGNIKIMEVDYSYGKVIGKHENERSVVKITKKGNIYIGAQQEKIE